jgi:hypothetical protein
MSEEYHMLFGKQKTNLILTTVAVLLLTALLLILVLYKQDEPSAQSAGLSGDVSSVDLVGRQISGMTQMRVDNANGGFTIENSDGTYQVKELDGLPANGTLVQYMVESGFDVVVTEEVGTVDAAGDFGLEEPSAVVTIDFTDGSSFCYELGDPVPSEDDLRYMRVKGTSYVYVVNTDSRLLQNSGVFLSADVVNSSDSEVDYFSLSGSQFPQGLTVKQTETGYRLTVPEEAACEPEAVERAVAYLPTLPSKGVKEVRPDEDTLARYGLLEPDIILEYQIGQQIYRLSIVRHGGRYFVLRSGVDLIYEVEAQYVEHWYSVTSFSLRDKHVLPLQAEDVASISVFSAGEERTVMILKSLDEFKSTEEKPAYIYELHDERGCLIPGEDFLSLVESLNGLLAIGEDQPAKGETHLQLNLWLQSGARTSLLLLEEDNRYFAVLNGEPAGEISRADAQKIYSVANALLSSK